MIAFKISKFCQLVEYLVKNGSWQVRLSGGGRSGFSGQYIWQQHFKGNCLLTKYFQTKTEDLLTTHPHSSKNKLLSWEYMICNLRFLFTSAAAAAKSVPQIFWQSRQSVLSFTVNPKQNMVGREGGGSYFARDTLEFWASFIWWGGEETIF